MFSADQLRFLDFGPFSFKVERGECLGLMGPSGAGKSLLLRALADLEPHTGTVRLDGVPARDIPPPDWRGRVGLLPSRCGWWCERVGDHFPDDIDFTPLGFPSGVVDWEVRRLSSGERQRLGFLRLLAAEPEVLLLDEPTAHLDPENQVAVEALLHGLKPNRITVLVSHDRAQLDRLADRSYRLEGGLHPL